MVTRAPTVTEISGPVAADMAVAVNMAAGQSLASKVAGRQNTLLRIYNVMIDGVVSKSTVRVHTAMGTRYYRMPHTFSYHKNAWRGIAWMRPMIIVHLAFTHRLHSFFECHHKQNRTKPCYRVVPKANNAMESHLSLRLGPSRCHAFPRVQPQS